MSISFTLQVFDKKLIRVKVKFHKTSVSLTDPSIYSLETGPVCPLAQIGILGLRISSLRKTHRCRFILTTKLHMSMVFLIIKILYIYIYYITRQQVFLDFNNTRNYSNQRESDCKFLVWREWGRVG